MRVLLADDHRLMLDGIRRALDEDGGFEVVGETQNGAQVLPLVGQTNPDLVVLDGARCTGGEVTAALQAVFGTWREAPAF